VARNFTLAVLYFREWTMRNQPAFVEHYNAIRKAPGSPHVVCNHDQGSLMFFLLHQ
jgi:hypothetical protein